MTLKTALRYLTGDPDAIREVARDKSALWTGMVLVLTAGIAREYDQDYFFAQPHKFFEPLLISFFSALVIFVFVRPLNASSSNPLDGETLLPTAQPPWITVGPFLGIFWMMAPIAWLYAIPFERFLTPGGAAQANITLLCIVAGWRVLLMSRVISVLSGSLYSRALFTVLLPSSMMVFVGSVGTSMSHGRHAVLAGRIRAGASVLVWNFCVIHRWIGLADCYCGIEAMQRASPY